MAAQTKHELIVTTPSKSTVAVERTFDAPARLVWAAHTQPEYIKQWLLGPDGWDMPVCEVDLREGGTYRWEWSHPTEAGFGFTGTYTAVEPHRRLAHTERFLAGERMEEMGDSTNEYTLEERDGKTILRIVMDYGTEEARDAVVATGMTDGMATSYDRLDDLLPKVEA